MCISSGKGRKDSTCAAFNGISYDAAMLAYGLHKHLHGRMGDAAACYWIVTVGKYDEQERRMGRIKWGNTKICRMVSSE